MEKELKKVDGAKAPKTKVKTVKKVDKKPVEKVESKVEIVKTACVECGYKKGSAFCKSCVIFKGDK